MPAIKTKKTHEITVDGVKVSVRFNVRRYSSQFYCWVLYHNGCDWDELPGDPWPSSRPKASELIEALRLEGLYVGASVKANMSMGETRKSTISEVEQRENGEFRYWLADGGLFFANELTRILKRILYPKTRGPKHDTNPLGTISRVPQDR